MDITQLMLQYRECSRNLWNMYIRQQVSEFNTDERNEWDIKDEYDEICTILFSTLVLAPIGKSNFKKSHSYEKYQKELSFIDVVPCNEIPILINREVGETSGYWDYPLKSIQPADVGMRFVDFFDFDRLGFRDFEYIQVRIVESMVYPDLVQRDALVIPRYVKMFRKG